LNKKEIISLLSIDNEAELQQLFDKAYATKLQYVGKKVYFRGIIEISNICIKNCYYCGIRRDNRELERYEMDSEEVIEAALWAYDQRYGSIVIQSGEREDSRFIEKITKILRELKSRTSGRLGITLSLGEQKKEVYKEWFDAGAHRYLLRVETTNEELYKKCHPADHSLEQRITCLEALKELGYQVGTGVLIGLPDQTLEDLAEDILFFHKHDIDMIGMGPYIVHNNTPFNRFKTTTDNERNLQLALKMIAVTRIFLRNVNIASTTALQAISPVGRELGLKAGANIIMPVITDIKYRLQYLLYEGKPCLDENADQCRDCLENRIRSIEEEIGYNEWGDSHHFMERKDRE